MRNDPYKFNEVFSENYYQYTVYSNGVIYNNTSGKIIKFTKNKATGYYQACIRINKAPATVYLHRILAELFIPKTSLDQVEVNHINGNKEDNRLENLEWVTSKENAKHFREKLLKTGTYTPISSIQKQYILKHKSKKMLQKLQASSVDLNNSIEDYKLILKNFKVAI